MPNNWKGHLGILASELCFKNVLGLLINNRSSFQEEQIIIRKSAATFREEQIIARKFRVNHWAKWIIIGKIARIKTIGVMKMRGNFIKISFEGKFLRKARNIDKICVADKPEHFCPSCDCVPGLLSDHERFVWVEQLGEFWSCFRWDFSLSNLTDLSLKVIPEKEPAIDFQWNLAWCYYSMTRC